MRLLPELVRTKRFQIVQYLNRGNQIWRQLQRARESVHCQFSSSTVTRQGSKDLSDKMAPVLGDVTNAPAEPAGTPTKRAKLETNVTLKFAKLSENATEPKRTTKQAAGFDLCSAYDYEIPAGGKICAKTDLQIALPDGCYGRVAPRSGLAVKHFIDVGAGVVDQDYRGNVGVVLFNFGSKEFTVSKGDRIAQLILERIFVPDLEELPTLDETERGAGGFGSTGTN